MAPYDKKVVAVTGTTDYLDGLDSGEAKVTLDSVWDHYSVLQDYEGTISSFIYGRAPSRLVVRKSDDYLVLAQFPISWWEEPIGSGEIYVEEGEMWGACYYFKEVEPPSP